MLALRRAVGHWHSLVPPPDPTTLPLSATAGQVLAQLREKGACFFLDLVGDSALAETQVEQALSELVAWGLVSCDSFAGLRALVTPARARVGSRRRRARLDEAGRWALLRPPAPDPGGGRAEAEAVEHIAGTLLRRYGVVMRKVLERESGLPPWRELLYVYRRLEARGEIRGGRFVAGFSGEQFALPEAIGALRGARREPRRGDILEVAAADPLNLTGIITPGERVAARLAHVVLYRDGVPVGVKSGRQMQWLIDVPPEPARAGKPERRPSTAPSQSRKRRTPKTSSRQPVLGLDLP